MLLRPHGSPGVLLLLLAEGFAVAAGVVAVLGGEAAANLVDFGDRIVGGVRVEWHCDKAVRADGDQSSSQFSTLKPGTWRKSRRFRESSVAS